MSPNKSLFSAPTMEETTAAHCVYSLLSSSCQGQCEERPGSGPYSIWPFSWSLRHVITLLLTSTAVKHVSSPNHNKDNRGSALRSIAQRVDMCVCACWHYSWAVIWSEPWSKCLWWLGVICFPGLWSMVCSCMGRVCVASLVIGGRSDSFRQHRDLQKAYISLLNVYEYTVNNSKHAWVSLMMSGMHLP